MKEFEKLGLSKDILNEINKIGFKQPTLIQEKSIPSILEGKDVIGESATGSGKTLAFGSGIIQNIKEKHGIQALILTPTRELAEQVMKSLRVFSGNKLNALAVYGGVSLEPQIQHLKKAEVVIATPGRLLDHMQRNTINLSKVKILVLDEADRMLDMGFIDDVEKIIKSCPKERQTLFFSATISSEIKKLSGKYMKNPVEVFATKMVDPEKLKQVYYDIQRNMKLSLLVHLLQDEKSELVMVFSNTRRTVDFISRNLKANKINAIAIHGGFSQNKRNKTIELFNKARATVLICTDVAARGLHIDNVSHVYNYDIPKDPKDYVHRIGRTARAGEEGKVINLLSPEDHESFAMVKRTYEKYKIEKIERPYLKRIFPLRDSSFRRPQRTFRRNYQRRW